MKWFQFVMVLILFAFASFAEVTRETLWYDVPDTTKVGTVVDLGQGGGGDIGPAIDYTTAVSNKMEIADADRYTKSEADGLFMRLSGTNEIESDFVLHSSYTGQNVIYNDGPDWRFRGIAFSATGAEHVDWSGVEGKPKTLSGYGITDAYKTNSLAFSNDVSAVVGPRLDVKREKTDLNVYIISESWDFIGGTSGPYRVDISHNADPSHPESFVYVLGDDSIQDIIDEYYSYSRDLLYVVFQRAGIIATRGVDVVRNNSLATSYDLTNIAVVTDTEIDYGKPNKFTRVIGSSIDLSGYTYANRIIYMNADFAPLNPERIYFRNRNNKTLIDIIRDEITNDVVSARSLAQGYYCFTNATVSVSLPAMPTVGNPVTVGSDTVSTDDGSTYMHSPSDTQVFLGNCTNPQVFMATEVNDEAQNLRYTITADDGRFYFTPTSAINQED